MIGVAEIKTHVLRREEKGLFGIPFKRYMAAAVVAVFAYMIAKPLCGVWSIPVTMVIYVLAMIFAAERGGLPLYQRVYLGWRGRLILSAWANPEGYVAQFAEAVTLPTDLVVIDSDVIFAREIEVVDADLTGVAMFANPLSEQRGVQVVADPVAALLARREARRRTATQTQETVAVGLGSD